MKKIELKLSNKIYGAKARKRSNLKILRNSLKNRKIKRRSKRSMTKLMINSTNNSITSFSKKEKTKANR